VRRKFVIEKEI